MSPHRTQVECEGVQLTRTVEVELKKVVQHRFDEHGHGWRRRLENYLGGHPELGAWIVSDRPWSAASGVLEDRVSRAFGGARTVRLSQGQSPGMRLLIDGLPPMTSSSLLQEVVPRVYAAVNEQLAENSEEVRRKFSISETAPPRIDGNTARISLRTAVGVDETRVVGPGGRIRLWIDGNRAILDATIRQCQARIPLPALDSREIVERAVSRLEDLVAHVTSVQMGLFEASRFETQTVLRQVIMLTVEVPDPRGGIGYRAIDVEPLTESPPAPLQDGITRPFEGEQDATT